MPSSASEPSPRSTFAGPDEPQAMPLFAEVLQEAYPSWYEWCEWGHQGEHLAETAQVRGHEQASSASWSEQPHCLFIAESTEHFAAEWARQLADDLEVGSLLTDQFVCHWAARDEHPDLAMQIQQVLGMTAQAQGWPVLAFGVPDHQSDKPGHQIAWCGAIPFGPLRDGSKRMGVARMALEFIETLHNEEQNEKNEAQALLREAQLMAAQRPETAGDPPKPSLWLPSVESGLLAVADTLEGGFGPAPRRLQPAALQFLWQRSQQSLAPKSLGKQFERSIDALVTGAVHDHLGGGFFHGCDDQAWSRPTFDKRLRDQALLSLILLPAAAANQRPVWREAALHALGWCVDHLRLTTGWYGAGTGADSANAQGQLQPGMHVLWSQDAVGHIVGEQQAKEFASCYLTDERSHYGDGWYAPTLRQASVDADLPQTLHRLLVARQERPQPTIDRRVLIADHALLLRALRLAAAADAADAKEPRWAQAADELAALLRSYHGSGSQRMHASR